MLARFFAWIGRLMRRRFYAFSSVAVASGPDLIPDAFSFAAVSNAALSTVYTSNTITVSGVTPGFSVGGSLSGAGFTYSQNGAAYQAPGAFTFQNGDTFTLRGTSSGANSTGETAVLSLGITLSNWTVTTLAASATLSSPTASATSSSTASLGVTTNTGSGTLYWVLSASSTVPTAAQIIAGQDSTGLAAPKAGSQAVSASGVQAVSATGLTTSTSYFAFFIQVSGGVNSNIAAAASFTTGAMATPTLSIVSATGTAPLTLGWSDADYIVGYYGQLEIDQTSNAFSNITQNIVFFVDGSSWANLDESIGLVTPSGTYWARIRALRDNDGGATTISGAKDTSGSTIPDFNADASAWSNIVNDSINVSTAALTSTAGTSASKLLAFSGTPTLGWNIPSGNGGANEFTRATISAQHDDGYSELTVGTLVGQNVLGMTDTSIDFNGAGSGFFGGGTAFPGNATFNGFSLFVVPGGTSLVVVHDSTTTSIAIPAAAAGDKIGQRYSISTNTLTVYYKSGSSAMAQIGSQITLTSLIPATPFAFTGGKSSLDSGSWNPGNSAFALGATGPNGSPSGSNIYG